LIKSLLLVFRRRWKVKISQAVFQLRWFLVVFKKSDFRSQIDVLRILKHLHRKLELPQTLFLFNLTQNTRWIIHPKEINWKNIKEWKGAFFVQYFWVSEMPFPGFWGRFDRILLVRKQRFSMPKFTI
jgi:hypothetical protein